MSFQAMFGSNKENEKTEDETFEDSVVLKAQISKLTAQNESYRQQLHDLNRKLETNVTMQSELGESNETLERLLREQKAASNRRINEIEERHMACRKDLEERIEEMEVELAKKSKENGELCEKIKINADTLSALSRAQRYSTSKEDDSELLNSQIEELTELLAQETENRKQLEAAIEYKESQCNEMREILTASKRQQAEKDKVLEGMRDQLMIYKNELESSKTKPESGCKGNSLFAEVEDRRKMTLEQMNAMRNGYMQAKRSFQAKEAEIKSLKAERAIFLRKWEDDSVERVQQNASLVEKYKARIAELEKQLKDERKKHAEQAKSLQMPESRFTFLQTLVDAKKREVEELRTKIENDSINALLEEETRHKMGKQLRYWRFRAMTGEAQLLSIKHRLESDPSSSNVDILETMKTLSDNVKEIESNESMALEPSHRETTIVDETIVTLDNLMTIPKVFTPLSSESSLSYFRSIEETGDASLTESICEMTKVTEDLSVIEKSDATSSDSKDGGSVCVVKTEMPTSIMQESDDSSADQAKSEQKFVPAKSSADLRVYLLSKETNVGDKQRLRSATDTSNPSSTTLEKQAAEKPNESSGSSVDQAKSKQNSVAINPVAPILKSERAPSADLSAYLPGKEINEKDKKTLRFTVDTVDPPSKPLKKRPSDKPKYPIVFISSNKSKV